MAFDLKIKAKRNPGILRTVAGCLLLLLFAFACERVVPPTVPPQAPAGYPRPYRVLGKWYQPIPHSKDFRQKGIASWYGKKFHGRKTATGETYDMYAVSAAHKTLPLHTHVRVRNLNNNKQIDVRINDRGPFVRGRIIDLSYAAAKAIGIVGPGTAPVEIVALGTVSASQTNKDAGGSNALPNAPAYVPADYYKGNFTIQVGAFKDKNNAERLKQKLAETYKSVHISEFNSGDEIFYRVRVGKSSTLQKAMEYEAYLIENGYKNAIVIAE